MGRCPQTDVLAVGSVRLLELPRMPGCSPAEWNGAPGDFRGTRVQASSLVSMARSAVHRDSTPAHAAARPSWRFLACVYCFENSQHRTGTRRVHQTEHVRARAGTRDTSSPLHLQDKRAQTEGVVVRSPSEVSAGSFRFALSVRLRLGLWVVCRPGSARRARRRERASGRGWIRRGRVRRRILSARRRRVRGRRRGRAPA